MLRVGYSATIWDGATSGIGNYIAEQLDVLARLKGVELGILTCCGAVLGADKRPTDGATGPGIDRVITPVRDILRHRGGLERVVREHRFDVFHSPTIRRLPARVSCATAATVHDLAPLRMAGKYGLLRDIFHRKLVPRWLRNVDVVVTPSAATKRDLIEIYRADADRVEVVPNGIDHATYRPGDRRQSLDHLRENFGLDAPFFVFVSRLEHPAKNHIRLIEAFEQFKAAAGSTHRLVFVGGDWHGAEQIRQRAAALVERGDLLITGFVPRDSMPHFLRAAEAVVYPSLFEGFGLPVIEAMACGAPVACSRGSSLTEIAEGRAILFDPESVESMAAALAELAGAPGLREKLSALGRSHAAAFTWERNVAQTVAQWQRAVELNQSRRHA